MILNDWLRNMLGTHSELEPQAFNPPVFITGCMRSGTTMLVNKITQHPQLLKVGGELNHIWTEIGGGSVYPINEYKDATDAQPLYSNNMTHYYSRSIEDAKSMKRHIMRAVYKWKTGGGRVRYDWDHLRIVNKSPHLINKTTYLNALYPESKIILIIRPIYEQVASLKMHYLKTRQKRALPVNPKESWRDPSKNAAEDLYVFPGDFKTLPLMWIRLNKIALEDLNKLSKACYTVVSYEELVHNQGSVIERLFDFLNLEGNHQGTEQKIISNSIKIFNTSTQGDPQKKWEKHLTSEEKEVMRDVIETNRADYDFIIESIKNAQK